MMKVTGLSLLSCVFAVCCTSLEAWATHNTVTVALPAPHVSHGTASHPGHSWAHGHGHGGHYFGGGLYAGWPWFYPGVTVGYGANTWPAYADSFYVQAAAPVEYVEMTPPGEVSKAASANSWYYCKKPEGYYPYVKTCDEAWEIIPAQPPAN